MSDPTGDQAMTECSWFCCLAPVSFVVCNYPVVGLTSLPTGDRAVTHSSWFSCLAPFSLAVFNSPVVRPVSYPTGDHTVTLAVRASLFSNLSV